MTFLVSYFLKPSPKLFDFTQRFSIINCYHSLQIKMYWALLFYGGAIQQHWMQACACTQTHTKVYLFAQRMFWGHSSKKKISVRIVILLYCLWEWFCWKHDLRQYFSYPFWHETSPMLYHRRPQNKCSFYYMVSPSEVHWVLNDTFTR